MEQAECMYLYVHVESRTMVECSRGTNVTLGTSSSCYLMYRYCHVDVPRRYFKLRTAPMICMSITQADPVQCLNHSVLYKYTSTVHSVQGLMRHQNDRFSFFFPPSSFLRACQNPLPTAHTPSPTRWIRRSPRLRKAKAQGHI